MRGRLLTTLLSLLMVVPMSAQTFTTGTLQLRNGQGQAVGLTLPASAVAPYTLQLPDSIGVAGQVMTLTAVAGSTATLEWSTADFWGLSGSTISASGTAAGQRYLGTANAQDLVIAANAAERMRVIGVAGPTQGYIGFGTSTPASLVDVRGDLTLSNGGAASSLRFAEPTSDGTNVTAFKAQAQAADITYTLPAAAPALDGMVLTATASGTMSWSTPGSAIPRGSYTPSSSGDYIHVIPTTGHDLQADDLPFVTCLGNSGFTYAAVVKSVDATNNTITVETSTGLSPTDRVMWMVLPK
ncbi:MAG: hypothetical protein FGM24_06210 [Candidatus Kapabacteria bacterium]|nr:hypothetical protein [Candidatus Kapabacteria bacterium]